jgi:hypothetical protein
MMARRLIGMVHCGGPVSQICTGCGHVFSELTMPLRHRGRNEDFSPPDFDGGRLGNYSGQGVVRLTYRDQKRLKQDARSPCRHRIPPFARRLGSEDPQRRSRDEMALKVEGVVDRGMHAEEALGRSSRFEPLHLALSSPHRLM